MLLFISGLKLVQQDPDLPDLDGRKQNGTLNLGIR